MKNRTDTDPEAHALARLVGHMESACLALVAVAEARRDRGGETLGIEESLDHERRTLAGYTLALKNRRAAVAAQLAVADADSAARGAS